MVAPIFFVNVSPFNVLGAEEHRLAFINAMDAFEGRHPALFTPGNLPDNALTDIATTTVALLRNERVIQQLRQHINPKLLFLMFDERAEQAAAELKLQILHPCAALRRQLDSKVNATRLAQRAGVPSVPNVLCNITSYQSLRQAAQGLGQDLVVQTPFGDSGSTTFFISNEADYEVHAATIEAAQEVKIMKRICCQPAALEACVTKHGTLVGPLQAELVGFPELTPYRGGWCGNQLCHDDFGSSVRRKAYLYTIAIGEEMRKHGYRGVFGVDYLLDIDSQQLYFGELNPRITGAAPVGDLAAREQGITPLLTHHIEEWLGKATSHNFISLNTHWTQSESATGWGQLILDHLGHEETVTEVPASGLYRMQSDDRLYFVRHETHMRSIARADEALFLRTIEPGRPVRQGTPLGRLITRDRLITQSALTREAQRWIAAFRQQYHFSPRSQEQSYVC